MKRRHSWDSLRYRERRTSVCCRCGLMRRSSGYYLGAVLPGSLLAIWKRAPNCRPDPRPRIARNHMTVPPGTRSLLEKLAGVNERRVRERD